MVMSITAFVEPASLRELVPMPILRDPFNRASIVPHATPLLSLSLILLAACTSQSVGFGPPPPVASIDVSPGVATLAAGDSLDFSAVAHSADGSPLSVTLAWASTGGVMSVGGLYHAGTMPGTYYVIANTGDLSVADTAFITITP